MTSSPSTALILAGGLGTRLRPVVGDRPKVLAEIDGIPFISYLLKHLEQQGVRIAVLCTGFRGDLVQNRLRDRSSDMELRYSIENDPLGTAGAIRNALPFIQSDPVFVLNGDSFCDVELCDMLQSHIARKALATMALCRVDDTGRFGSVRFNRAGKILQFREKCVCSGKGWINAGIYILSREIIEEIPQSRFCSLERDIFPDLVNAGLFGFQCKSGNFIDIGTPESYNCASTFFASIRNGRTITIKRNAL